MYSWENYQTNKRLHDWKIVKTFWFAIAKIGGVFVQKVAPEKHRFATNK